MVQLILNKDKRPIGWKMIPKTEDEQLIAGTVRDLQFFGLDVGIQEENTNIKYNGLTLIDQNKSKTLGNIKSLSWIQGKYKGNEEDVLEEDVTGSGVDEYDKLKADNEALVSVLKSMSKVVDMYIENTENYPDFKMTKESTITHYFREVNIEVKSLINTIESNK